MEMKGRSTKTYHAVIGNEGEMLYLKVSAINKHTVVGQI